MPATAERAPRRAAATRAASTKVAAKKVAAKKVAAKKVAAKKVAAKQAAPKKAAPTKAAAKKTAAKKTAAKQPAASKTTSQSVSPRRPALALSIQLGERSPALPVERVQLRRWAQAALAHPAELVLRFVAEAEGRELNRAFRGRDYATNVLTFPYDEPDGTDEAPLRADIVICLPVLAREARAQRKTLRDHLAHLVVHGVLHAQGWDHLDDAQANAMETCERRLLARFRIADPYRDGIAPG